MNTRNFLAGLFSVILLLNLFSCRRGTPGEESHRVRGLVDTVGFAHLPEQMDSIMARIVRYQGDKLLPWTDKEFHWRMCISPHDDYAYAGWLYPAVLSHLKARTLLLFGVAHKAAKLGLENKIVTGTFPYWYGIFGDIPVSPLREALFSRLDTSLWIRSDSMISLEHSLEALLPFLQYYNRDIEIIPVLVPAMDYYRMDEIARTFSDTLAGLMRRRGLEFGNDLAIVISTDAVHYGDEGWGGKNYAVFGTDSAGTHDASTHEMEIIKHCLLGPVLQNKVQLFTRMTVQDDNYRVYKWTWCGRYSVPFGLLAGFHLQQSLDAPPLGGKLVGYANSIDHEALKVNDLGMGTTAPANPHHWVGYAAVGYK